MEKSFLSSSLSHSPKVMLLRMVKRYLWRRRRSFSRILSSLVPRCYLPLFFHRPQNFFHQIAFEIFRIVVTQAQADEDEVEAGNGEAVIVAEAGCLHEILRSIGMVGVHPPQPAVIGFDLHPFPGEIVI